METRELKDKFWEVVNLIPFDEMGKNGKNGKTLYQDVEAWCNDYFNNSENKELALKLVWSYSTKKAKKNKK